MKPPATLDEDSYDRTVETIYAAAAATEIWPEALDRIARLFDDAGCVLVFQRSDGSYGTIVSPGLEAAQRDYVEQGWSRADIRMQRAIERQYVVRREAITERHILSEEDLATQPFYTEFLARHGLGWFAGLSVSPDPRLAVVVSMQRLASRPAYTDDELARFTRLSRHVEAALRLSIRLINAEVIGLTLTDAFSRLSIGVYVLDGEGRIDYVNEAGGALMGKGLIAQDGRLSTGFRPEADVLATAIESALTGWSSGPAAWPPRPILVRGTEPGRFIAVHFLPVTRQDDIVLFGARAIVLAVESAVNEPDPAVVRDLLGLTLGEARIAALVGSGLPPRDAAGRLGISEQTVRSTLKRVFEKVGVFRQSELALLITRLVLAR